MFVTRIGTGVEEPAESERRLSSRSPMVDEERMRLSHLLRLVLRVPFSALTLMVGWQEGHSAFNKSCSSSHQRFGSGIGRGEGLEGEPTDPG